MQKEWLFGKSFLTTNCTVVRQLQKLGLTVRTSHVKIIDQGDYLFPVNFRNAFVIINVMLLAIGRALAFTLLTTN